MAQPFSSIDLDRDKPVKYENRKLASEKSSDKKIKPVERFFQNTFTHYNYYFNANAKVNDVLQKTVAANADNFTTLLPFYPYSFNKTKQYTVDIDSIIYKCTAGILLHNLKNAWIDDMYLLMGKAYLLKENFDSALYVFQYLNYAWAPKEEDGYDIILGSNVSNTNGIFTIATNETKGGVSKWISKKPTRNESFIWQIRTLIEKGRYADATSMIALLRADSYFPERLTPYLNEVTAYNFYQQQVYDSAAFFLSKTIDIAIDKTDKARRSFLCGQLYTLSNKKSLAATWFNKSIQYTTNPILEIYARLQVVQTTNAQTTQQENLNALYALGKKDKYVGYKDIIYYAAALLEYDQKNYNKAAQSLQKSLQNNIDNNQQRQEAFLLLAKTYTANKQYTLAANYYDSLQMASFATNLQEQIEYNKSAVKTIATNVESIRVKDSVLAIAALPEKERVALVRKLVKQLRKAEGLKDVETTDFGSDGLPIVGSAPVAPSLFGEANTDFYFNNAQRKQRGIHEFKSKWGNRPNVDNWRRQQAIVQPSNSNAANFSMQDVDDIPANSQANANDKQAIKDISFEGLMGNIPLREEQKKAAHTVIENALFDNGLAFQNKLEDYPEAVAAFEQLLMRYGNTIHTEKAMRYLLYCYTKTKQTRKADSLQQLLNKKFAIAQTTNKATQQATNVYEEVYNLFVEGRFEAAKAAKKKADSMVGKSYYTPQLLFIEAVAYVQQKQDSIAIQKLNDLQNAYPDNALSARARTLVEVVKKRAAIEQHLANYTEEKNIEEAEKRVDITTTTVNKIEAKPIQKIDSVSAKKPTTVTTLTAPSPIIQAPTNNNNYQFNPIEQHYVLIVFDKVDDVFVNESRNAFNNYLKQNFYSKSYNIGVEKLNATVQLFTIGNFDKAGDAVDVLDALKPITANRIIPFIPASKYTYFIISSSNYNLLKQKGDIAAYQQFLHAIFPDKF